MIVIDTHILIWFVEADGRLGNEAREQIERAAIDAIIWVPAICAWEIALLEKKEILPFGGGSLAWIREALALPGFTQAPFEAAIAIDSVKLDWNNRDPADRIIVATARHLREPLLTADRKILEYATAGHLEAIDARR